MAATDGIGKPLPPQRVVIERGPVTNFAAAVTDDNPIHHDARAAAEAGFDAIPTPPTYSFSWAHWGTFPEIQPEGTRQTNPVMEAIGLLMKSGGLMLHGEQEFEYHRPVVVGDVLTSRGTIKDVYEKASSGGSTMTFVVTETDWLDDGEQPVITERFTLIHRG